jgi:hypothetical protein
VEGEPENAENALPHAAEDAHERLQVGQEEVVP